MLEIELKAHIDDIEAIALRVTAIPGVTGPKNMVKQDCYYSDGKRPVFRLRQVDGRCTVTRKHKQIFDGVEFNDEIEFDVSDQASADRFFRSLGYQEYVRKHKEGSVFRYGDISIELWDVEGLGSYIELELLLDSDTPDTEMERSSSERLRQLLRMLRIDEHAIESRYYTDMLISARQ